MRRAEEIPGSLYVLIKQVKAHPLTSERLFLFRRRYLALALKSFSPFLDVCVFLQFIDVMIILLPEAFNLDLGHLVALLEVGKATYKEVLAGGLVDAPELVLYIS